MRIPGALGAVSVIVSTIVIVVLLVCLVLAVFAVSCYHHFVALARHSAHQLGKEHAQSRISET